MSPISIREVMTDPHLFGGMFGGDTWAAWRALIFAFYGLKLNHDERRILTTITGRAETPQEAMAELWLVVGRRGGKSQIAALLAVYHAAFCYYTDRLSPGEVATVMILAADRKQARAIFRYVIGLLHSNPMLEALIIREDKESIELNNRTVIEIGTASFRATRGYTYGAILADEIAFWRSEDSANPDYEIIAALRPGLATLDGVLIALSSPHAKSGELWEHHKKYHGTDDPHILVAQADSMTMNPKLPARVVAAAMERDPAAAAAEYGALFRSDLETFVSREAVDAVVQPGRYELGYLSKWRYRAFCDPSGGSGTDSFTLCIAHDEHRQGQTVTVVDAVREVRPPFSPDAVITEFATLLKNYRLASVTGDRYAGEYPRELFRKQGIRYEVATLTASELYRDLLPLINSDAVELLDHPRVINQLCALERRVGPSGKDAIVAQRGNDGHGDAANSVAGAIVSGRSAGYYNYADLL